MSIISNFFGKETGPKPEQKEALKAKEEFIAKKVVEAGVSREKFFAYLQAIRRTLCYTV